MCQSVVHLAIGEWTFWRYLHGIYGAFVVICALALRSLVRRHEGRKEVRFPNLA